MEYLSNQKEDSIAKNEKSLIIIFQDCIFLGVIVFVSAAPYIQKLGFYSDDWAFLARLHLSHARSFIELLDAFFRHNLWMRPVQGLYLSELYNLFGINPFGYHLVNTIVICLGIILFYLTLVELGLPRLIALAAPVVYALLPHYSTDRFWYSAFQAPLSMTFYFLSLYCDLRTVRSESQHLWIWKLLALISLLVSTLSYEVFIPLFLLNPFLVLYSNRTQPNNKYTNPKTILIIFGCLNLSALIIVSVYKAAITSRITPHSLTEQLSWFANFFKDVTVTAVTGDFGFRLPAVLLKILRDYPDPYIFCTGFAVGLIVFWYLCRAVNTSEEELTGKFAMPNIMLFGLLLFGLGYSIFITNQNADTSATGICNRVTIAAAAGLALVLTGGFGWLTTWIPYRTWRTGFFCASIALLCASGFIIINTLSLFWATAAQRQQIVMKDILSSVPALPSGSTLIIDGICRYVGPAPVFETQWDVTGALRLIYQDPSLRGNVASTDLEIRDDGLYSKIYGTTLGPYIYQNLFIYNHQRKSIYSLTDANSARHYFTHINPYSKNGCRWSKEGLGETVFGKNDPKVELLRNTSPLHNLF